MLASRPAIWAREKWATGVHAYFFLKPWVFPTPAFRLNLLVAMEDTNGYVLGLGIIQRIMEESREVTLVTPLSSLQGVDAITLGDVILDSQTFFDQPASVD